MSTIGEAGVALFARIAEGAVGLVERITLPTGGRDYMPNDADRVAGGTSGRLR
jgi:hypothetical protein